MSALLNYCLTAYWAIEPGTMGRMVDVLNRHFSGTKLDPIEVAAAIGRDPAQPHPRNRSYEVRDGVAIIPVQGVIAKYARDVNGSSQPKGTSAELMQRDLQAAAADAGVRAIVLAIDSPGGAVSGTPDTGDLIAQIAQRIPVVAHIEDLGASAGYWLASQATKVYANRNALVGSIGVISRLVDSSEMTKAEGIKVHVIRSVSLKAPGQMGEAINDAQIADATRLIGSLHDLFTAAVAKGRGMSADQIATVAPGQLWLAEQAKGLGLIDGISSLDELISTLSTSPSTITGTPMKILATALSALILAHPAHASLIAAEAEKDADEPTILAKIAEAKAKAGGQRISALEAEVSDMTAKLATANAAITAEQTAHAATKAQLTAANEQLTKLGKAKSETPKDVGGDAAKGLDGLIGEARWKAEFNASAELQEQFAIGGMDSYCAFKRQEAKAKTKG